MEFKKLEPFSPPSYTQGFDPELFIIDKNNKVIGSEKIIPQKGLKTDYDTSTKIVRDGVQCEIHVSPDTCRARLGNKLSSCFKALNKQLNTKEELKATFNVKTKINKKRLISLSKESQMLGCMPSKNIYLQPPNPLNTIDPLNYRVRTAGGHIHISLPTRLKKKRKTIVKILDIIVGNTCVLFDRDPGNKERRKLYGRAGEYRTPPHGLEYRTLSNFWLKTYPMTSLVLSMTRFATAMVEYSNQKNNYIKELTKLVDIKDIEKAINTNNKTLALQNFKKIQKFLESISTSNSITTSTPFSSSSCKVIRYLAKGKNYEKTLIPKDPMKKWTNLPEAHNGGWEDTANKLLDKIEKC